MVPLRLSSSVSLEDFGSPRNGSHPFPITIHQVHELELIGTVISTISGVLLVPLLLINLIMKERRSFPSRLTTLYISMALGLHVTVLVGLITGTTDFFSFIRFHEVSEGCKIQGIFYQFFASATLWLWLLICSMLYCVIVRGMSFRELKRNTKCVLSKITLSGLGTSVLGPESAIIFVSSRWLENFGWWRPSDAI